MITNNISIFWCCFQLKPIPMFIFGVVIFNHTVNFQNRKRLVDQWTPVTKQKAKKEKKN